MRHVVIIRRRLRQKWYARFISDNSLTLAHTEHYANQADLRAMLKKYYPDWPIELKRHK